MSANTRWIYFIFWAVCLLFLASLTTAASQGQYKNMGECAEGYYGYNCRHHCHCRHQEDCGITADCQGHCADGWTGPTCQSQNFAFGMPSTIRSKDPQARSRSAVDGNSSTCVTSEPENPGWLRLDLQSTTDVYYLSLIIAEDTLPRGWQVFVTEYSDFYWNTPCATVRSDLLHVHMSCDSPTSGRYVTVFNTQGPISLCELQVYVCADYSFGVQCQMTCHCADASEVCHPLTGHCRTGCRPGYTGRDCQQRCNMTYGSNCVTACGHCRRGLPCDPVTGGCPADCQPGWMGKKCDTRCESGFYGTNCTSRCSGCQDNATCAADTGFCPGLCQPGLRGPRCDQDCPEGRYGPSCQFACGHCSAASRCNSSSGVCPKGCQPGWEGLFCTQECLSHNYGVDCLSGCPFCLTSCDSKTGFCDVNGCVIGKRGRRCEEDCKSGYYGKGCNNKCGHCQKGPCDVITGHCPLEWCETGWDGPGCDQPCPARTYGDNCTEECGACDLGDICHHITGDCPGGCAERYHGDKCKTLAIYVDTTSETSIAVIASVLSVVLFVVIVVCVCLFIKWRRDAQVILV